jgi:uncharacterized membrane protein
MLQLSAALAFLVASHLVPSRDGVRARLVGAMGRRAYLAAYSVVSLLALWAVVAAYRAADAGLVLWSPAFEGRYVALAAMPVALLLLVCRLTQRPSAEARGIYRITTTPGSLAVVLWSLVHLLNVAAFRTVLLFLGMLAIALGSLLRNASRSEPRGAMGAVPFARVISGRERLALGEIGAWRLLLALGLTAAILLLHPIVIGVDPLAGLT